MRCGCSHYCVTIEASVCGPTRGVAPVISVAVGWFGAGASRRPLLSCAGMPDNV